MHRVSGKRARAERASSALGICRARVIVRARARSGLGPYAGVCLLGFFRVTQDAWETRASGASSALGICRAREIFRAREIHRCLLARVF